MRLSPLADAWVVGWITANFFISNTGRFGGCLSKQSQIGLSLFAETLQFVERSVKSTLQAAFLAVEHGQRLGAQGCQVTHPLVVIQLEFFSIVGGVFHFEGVEAGFHMVESAKTPGCHG